MKKLSLTKDEKKQFKDNIEGARDVLVAKAILDVAEGYKFEDIEKSELEYLTKNEIVKYFVGKKLDGKVNVEDEEVAKIYTESKEYFDNNNVSFTEAKELIKRDLTNQKALEVESEIVKEIVDNLNKPVEITKEDIVFSQGNAEVIKTITMTKAIEEKIKEEKFEKEEKDTIKIIKSNVLIGYYLDLKVRKAISVTQEEVNEVYEKEKLNLGNIDINEAYSQIANILLNNKAEAERNNIIKEISEKYNVEKIIKETF